VYGKLILRKIIEIIAIRKGRGGEEREKEGKAGEGTGEK